MPQPGPAGAPPPARIRIEFYGIPRERAGCEAITVDGSTLGAALEQAGRALPRFAEACLDRDRLRPGYLASINGTRFTMDAGESLVSGDTVLVLLAEVGG